MMQLKPLKINNLHMSVIFIHLLHKTICEWKLMIFLFNKKNYVVANSKQQ